MFIADLEQFKEKHFKTCNSAQPRTGDSISGESWLWPGQPSTGSTRLSCHSPFARRPTEWFELEGTLKIT